MAEALARHLADGSWQVESAGTSPAGWISAEAIEALREAGVDPRGLRSKGISDLDLRVYDTVVILSDASPEEVLPRGFQGEVEQWPTPDPVGSGIEAYREVRDQLLERIAELRLRLTGVEA